MTTSSLSLRHRCYSACSPRHGEYQTAGGIGSRGMGLRTPLLVSSSARLTLGVCVLTVENSARSAIVYLTLCKIVDEHSQMLTKRSVLWRSYHATSTLFLASLSCHSSHPDLQHPSVEHRLGLISLPSWDSSHTSCISTLAT